MFDPCLLVCRSLHEIVIRHDDVLIGRARRDHRVDVFFGSDDDIEQIGLVWVS